MWLIHYVSVLIDLCLSSGAASAIASAIRLHEQNKEKSYSSRKSKHAGPLRPKHFFDYIRQRMKLVRLWLQKLTNWQLYQFCIAAIPIYSCRKAG